MEETRPFPSISQEEYREIWNKSSELDSFHKMHDDLSNSLEKMKQELTLYSIHYRYRLPWMKAKPNKGFTPEKYFIEKRPEKEKITKCNNSEITDFISRIYQNRKTIINTLTHNDRILGRTENIILNNSAVSIDSFTATMIIPSIFCDFIGDENIDDFIEAVGLAFDSFETEEEKYCLLLNFESSFLCRVLREFLLSPFLREYLGEQFSSFYKLLKTLGDASNFSVYQNFFSSFMKEFMQPSSSAPSFLYKLFQRISRHYIQQQVIITVLVNSFIIPLIVFPSVLGVMPPYQYYMFKNFDTIFNLKYYANTICKLPMQDKLIQNKPVISPSERVEASVIDDFITNIMKERVPEKKWNVPSISTITINCAAVKVFASLMSTDLYKELTSVSDDEILHFSTESATNSISLFDNNKLYLTTLKTILSSHPDIANETDPIKRANLALIKSVDSAAFIEEVDKEIVKFVERSSHMQNNLKKLERVLTATKKGYYKAEEIFCESITQQILLESSTKSELKKKKNVFLTDSQAFAAFIIKSVDTFAAKNPWCTPILSHIGKHFITTIMEKYPLKAFIEAHKELVELDEKFLAQKESMLADFDKNGFEEKSAVLLKSPNILKHALNSVMRGFLFESPISSAIEIAKALSTAEDLFMFQYGEPPEANQLMPLLAHLFMTNSLPSQLAFGRWLAHFLQPLLEKKQDWFKDEDLNALEHYFQFNAWMEDMMPGAHHDE